MALLRMTLSDRLLIRAAMIFAFIAHGSINHRRRYTNKWYFTHLRAVVNIRQSAVMPAVSEEIAGLWLHDIIETTWVKRWMIWVLFGSHVTRVVDGLTERSKSPDDDPTARKAINLQWYSDQPAEIKALKLCDIIDNGWAILTHDRKFAQVYITEVEAIIEEFIKDDVFDDHYYDLIYRVKSLIRTIKVALMTKHA